MNTRLAFPKQVVCCRAEWQDAMLLRERYGYRGTSQIVAGLIEKHCVEVREEMRKSVEGVETLRRLGQY